MLLTYCIAAFMVSFFIALQIKGSIVYAQAEATKPFLFDPSPSVSSLDNYSSGGQGKEAEGKPTVQEVKNYIKAVFGRNWKTAWSVMQNECNYSRNGWPYCINSWGDTPTTGEHSVGPFQINLARQKGKGSHVHWDKVPGKDLHEKEVYLMNWKNNVLVANVISQGGTNWNPWSAYRTPGFYKTLNSL